MSSAHTQIATISDDSALPAAAFRNRPVSLSSVPLDPLSVGPVEGRVEGAWSMEVDEDVRPDTVFLLPDGDIMHVPVGTAILVQSLEKWHRCEFPQAGALHGPAVWAEIDPTSEDVLLQPHRNRAAKNSHDTSFFTCLGLALGTAVLSGSLIAAFGSLNGGVTFMVSATLGFTAAGCSVFPLSARLERRAREKVTIRSVDKRINRPVALPDRVRALAGYSPAAIEARMPHHETDEIDEEISTSLAAYYAARRELSHSGVALNETLEHVAREIGRISQRIQTTPRLLRDRDARGQYRTLIERATRDVRKAIEKQDGRLGQELLADVNALLAQMDRRGAPA